MSCCIIKKENSSAIKELDALQKHFDEVALEDLPKYRLLTLRDKANKPNYDYTVWLEVKVSYGYKNGYSSRDDNYMLQSVCKNILMWVDALKNFEKTNSCKQLSLFDDGSEDEELPLPPKPSSDGGWSSYHKKSMEVKKHNLMLKYSFFEFLNIKYFTYSGIDYRTKLPSIEEVRQLLKKALILGKDNPGRFDEFWFDDPSYFTSDGALSDIELKGRLSSIRLFLVPYTTSPLYWVDDSINGSFQESETDYRYHLNPNRELTTCGPHDSDKLELPSYDNLIDAEMLDFARKLFDIPCKEIISDEDILKENLKNYINSLLCYKRDEYQWQNKIQTFKDWRQFKADITSFLKSKDINPNGGGTGFSLDGFCGDYSLDQKGNIKITQNLTDRIEANRNINGLKSDDWNNERIVIFNLSGDEIYKKAFELFCNKQTKQLSIFDTMVA